MNYSWAMYRDKISINNQLAGDINRLLKEKQIPLGTTLLFAARIIEIQSDFEILDYDLVFLADIFDGSGGTIRVKVTQIPEDGQPGVDGRTVTIATKSLKGIKIENSGGVGGKGLPGNPGAKGRRGRKGSDNQWIEAENGGDGETGGTGGKGGVGGEVIVSLLEDELTVDINTIRKGVSCLGGEGGRGGPGGIRGEGGEGGVRCLKSETDLFTCIEQMPGEPGFPGVEGEVGASGSNGSCLVNLLPEEEYWLVIRNLSANWADYRIKVGEYYYRAFNANSVETESFIELAKGEFDSVLALLDPAQLDTLPLALDAKSYIEQLLGSITIFGYSRDLDILPDFPRYEEIFTKYHPLVSSVFDSAERFLSDSFSLDQKKTSLSNEVRNLEGLVSALEDEKSAAFLNDDINEREYKVADNRVTNINKRIEAKKAELEQAEVNLFGAVIGTVKLVASLVSAVPTAGVSFVGGVTSIIAIGGVISDHFDDKKMSIELTKDAFKGESREMVTFEKLKKEAKGLKGYVESILAAKQAFISFNKMQDELWQAQVDNEGYRKLIEDGVQASYNKLLADLRKQQSHLTKNALGKRLNQAKDNYNAEKNQLESFRDAPEVLKGSAFTLLKSALNYVDILQQYRFFALRAIEIYTSRNQSSQIRFDYGHIHPDWDKNYEDEFITIHSLISQYRLSWSRLTDLLNFRLAYDNYFASSSWVLDIERMSFSQADIIAEFKANPQLSFTLKAGDLINTRIEPHIEVVFVAFVGAKSNSGVISALVEHSGRYMYKTRNEIDINVVLKPRKAVALAKTKPLQDTSLTIGGAVTPDTIGFWGRGVVTNWLIQIEEDELRQSEVDLTGLTEIQVWIQYKSFLSNP